MSGDRIKGRALLAVDDRLVALFPDFSPKKPVRGEVAYNAVEIKEELEAWQRVLLLPADYAVVGVFFHILFQQWELVVESDAILPPAPGEMIPRIWPSYTRTEDGKVLIQIQL